MPRFGLSSVDFDDEAEVVVNHHSSQNGQRHAKALPIHPQRFVNDHQRHVEHDDLQYSDDEHLEGSSGDNATDSDDGEPPHPIGFGNENWDQCWFGLLSPRQSRKASKAMSAPTGRNKYSLYDSDDSSDDDDDTVMALYSPRRRQTFPPLPQYLDPNTAPTAALLQHEHADSKVQANRQYQKQENDDIDILTRLIQSACVIQQDSPSKMKSLRIRSSAETQLMIDDKVQSYRQKLHHDHERRERNLKKIIAAQEKEAQYILKQQQQQEDQEQREQEEKRAAVAKRQQQKDDAERQKAKDADDQRNKEKAEAAASKRKEDSDQAQLQKNQAEAEQQQQNRDAAQSTASSPTKSNPDSPKPPVDFVAKARKLVGQLIDLRASIESFENSRAVSKRRLTMKKTVRGKVNTLNEDSNKVRAVATEVCQAISVARQEDDHAKQAMKANQPGFTSEMARGKRYMLDLVASNAMTRVQADGFNGPRGDGFPLGCMLSMISVENKELVPIMAAHIYTVCPTAIPTLPTPAPDASEEELMSTLGMVKDKQGEFETFPKFLARTENIISLVTNIMTSSPSNHALLGGHRAAIDWLSRFLDLLPPDIKPLPLVTAPILVSFLTGAGHMLANKYGDAFKKHLDVISNDIVNRLDESDLGKPSATRLTKTLKGGFDGFRTTLPPRALADLYVGHGSGGGGVAQSSGITFGSSTGGASSSMPSPFESSGQQSSTFPSPFGGGQNSMGGNQSSQNMPPNAFGSSQPSQATNSPFGNAAPMQSGIGSSPFSQAPGPSPSPFGSSKTAAAPFGGGEGRPPTSAASPFGNPPQSQSPFGGGGPAQTPTPFGGGGVSMQAPSPFGGGAAPIQASSPFGGGGGGAPMQAASPFGGGVGGAPMQASSPFGGGGGAVPGPSPFGVASNSPFGGGGATPSPFGGPPSQAPSPFGGGQGIAASPFGGAAPSQSPFGAGIGSPSPFGGGGDRGGKQGRGGRGNNNQGGGFGGNNSGGGRGNKGNKPPCKFFAQGSCRFGDNCRFSHETGGGNQAGYNNSSSYGGRRR